MASSVAPEKARATRRALLRAGGGLLVAIAASALGWKVAPRAYNARRSSALAGRRVYDENADAEALLAASLQRAAQLHRRVLVILGGNWCQWCLALDDLMSSDEEIRAFVAERIVLLKLDSEAASSLDRAWGRPTQHGVPVLVFLEANGQVAHVQESVSLESWGGRILRHDRARVLAVLRRWS